MDRVVTIKIEITTRDNIKEYARKRGVTMMGYVKNLVNEDIKKYEKGE